MPPAGATTAQTAAIPISTGVNVSMPANPTMAPTTDYSTAYNEEGQIYNPEVAQEQAALTTLSQTQQASQASLDQAKANAFKTDTTNSNAKGLLFSGQSTANNNNYVTNTYNPAVTKLNSDTASSAQSLQDKITEINNERANAAETLTSDTTTANNDAAEKAASAAATAAKAPSQQDVVQAIRQGLSAVKGGDGYVSPQDYASAYEDWVTAGYSPSSFQTYFKSFENPNNGYYAYAEQQVQKKA
jgi:hypothetical protein